LGAHATISVNFEVHDVISIDSEVQISSTLSSFLPQKVNRNKKNIKSLFEYVPEKEKEEFKPIVTLPNVVIPSNFEVHNTISTNPEVQKSPILSSVLPQKAIRATPLDSILDPPNHIDELAIDIINFVDEVMDKIDNT
jgi:hypothetical protein